MEPLPTVIKVIFVPKLEIENYILKLTQSILLTLLHVSNIRYYFFRWLWLRRLPQKQSKKGSNHVYGRAIASTSSEFPVGLESGRPRFGKDCAGYWPKQEGNTSMVPE